MKQSFIFLVAVMIEIFLLALIFVFFVIGALGIFLPIIPGLVLIGLGVTVYSLMIKNEKGAIVPKVHRQVLKFNNRLNSLPLTNKLMGIVKKIKKKKAEKQKEEILKHGIILLGFNILIILGVVFGFVSLSFVLGLFASLQAVYIFTPLITIFVFSGLAAIIWYRFGQLLGEKFKKRRVTNAALVVLISLLPLLALLFVLASILDVVGGFKNDLLAITLLGIMLMSIIATVFEFALISFGAITIAKK